MSENDKKYADLRARQKIIQEELSKITSEINEVFKEIVYEQFQIKIGSIIKSKGSGELYQVLEIHYRFYNSPYDRPGIIGAPKKKDGSFGTARRHLWGEWEVITP